MNGLLKALVAAASLVIIASGAIHATSQAQRESFASDLRAERAFRDECRGDVGRDMRQWLTLYLRCLEAGHVTSAEVVNY